MMIERGANMAFAAGARVFPGGRLDADDHVVAASLGPDAPGDAAHRIAAIRETIEEVGLAIALDPLPSHEQTLALRAALAAGELFSTLLARHGLNLQLDALVPFARWCPPYNANHRIFDTLFYAASANHLPLTATVDGSETVHLVWTSAEQALADAEAGQVRIIFPTLCNLEKLGQLASFDDMIDHVARYPVELIQPGHIEIDGVMMLRIPDHLGYPRTCRPLDGTPRG
jgi:8-oxo-dGTP pyrophosphatase MutT (NUDIX family)